ncbi:MAG: multicomponent Na+:H+ antiporter subunit D [Glaciecola sp.]
MYQFLPWESDYKPYDITHVLTQLQLLAFSALAFVWLNKQGLYPPELKSVNLDIEFLYRKVVPIAGQHAFSTLSRIGGVLIQTSRSAFAMLPIKSGSNDASAATLTLRMVIGFVLLAFIALITELM